MKSKTQNKPAQLLIGFNDPSERKVEIRRQLWITHITRLNETRQILDADQLELFINHWGAVNPGGLKMAWEKARDKGAFDHVGRLRTWAKKNEIQEKRYQVRKAEAPKFPNYYDRNLDRTLQGNEVMKYHQHLTSLGWTKNRAPGGTTWTAPKNPQP